MRLAPRRIVLVGELSTGAQPNAHRFKVARDRHVHEDVDFLCPLINRDTFIERNAVERDREAKAHLTHAWERAHSITRLPVERKPFCRRVEQSKGELEL